MSDAKQGKKADITRRGFLRGATAAGAGLMFAKGATAVGGTSGGEDLNIALVGCGSQGRILLMDCLKIDGIRFKAICDIWEYHKKYAANILKAYKQDANVYTDYREMLANEKDLDAVIIAVPDWKHAEITIASLKAGLDVYCEKEMSNDLEEAKEMVKVSQETGNLLQIGHQRRSNPRYMHAEHMIYEEELLGRITHTRGQWHRAKRQPRGWPKKYVMSDEKLKKYGYESMEKFRNWRWYKKFSGGPICDLGSHQIDIFNWWLRAAPSAVTAMGGTNYYPDWNWWDSVIAVYEYDTPNGKAIGQYDVLNTTSFGGFYEVFMGDMGTMKISEDAKIGQVYREAHAQKTEWEDQADKVESMGKKAIELKVGETRKTEGGQVERVEHNVDKPVHTYHLENFFGAIRGENELTCPGEIGYETAVTVLKTNEAVRSGKKVTYKPEEFKV